MLTFTGSVISDRVRGPLELTARPSLSIKRSWNEESMLARGVLIESTLREKKNQSKVTLILDRPLRTSLNQWGSVNGILYTSQEAERAVKPMTRVLSSMGKAPPHGSSEGR